MKEISFTRLENLSGFGTPDVLAYNKKHTFFTIELKVAKGNSVKFSPHQISFHVRHPHNTFILQKALGPLSIKLYGGTEILKLHAHEPCAVLAESWPRVQEYLVNAT